MVKQILYFYDTGLSEVGGSAITDYTEINSGNQFFLNGTSVSLAMGKATTADPSLAKVDASGFYDESKVIQNSVGNRSYSIQGVFNLNDATDVTKIAYLLKMARSPAVFGFKSELTVNDDDPNTAPDISGSQSQFTSGSYVYVIVTDVSMITNSEDKNIIDFGMELVLVHD